MTQQSDAARLEEIPLHPRFVWVHSSNGECGVNESCLFDWFGRRHPYICGFVAGISIGLIAGLWCAK